MCMEGGGGGGCGGCCGAGREKITGLCIFNTCKMNDPRLIFGRASCDRSFLVCYMS